MVSMWLICKHETALQHSTCIIPMNRTRGQQNVRGRIYCTNKSLKSIWFQIFLWQDCRESCMADGNILLVSQCFSRTPGWLIKVFLMHVTLHGHNIFSRNTVTPSIHTWMVRLFVSSLWSVCLWWSYTVMKCEFYLMLIRNLISVAESEPRSQCAWQAYVFLTPKTFYFKHGINWGWILLSQVISWTHSSDFMMLLLELLPLTHTHIWLNLLETFTSRKINEHVVHVYTWIYNKLPLSMFYTVFSICSIGVIAYIPLLK